jgi:hypothetical protein
MTDVGYYTRSRMSTFMYHTEQNLTRANGLYKCNSWLKQGRFASPKHLVQPWGPVGFLFSGSWEYRGRIVEHNAHLQPFSCSGTSGALPLLPHIPNGARIILLTMWQDVGFI